MPAYFHAFVSVLSNVSPSATNCEEEDELVTCTQHGGFGRARKQAKAGESSEVEIRNCIENFCPV